MRRGPGVLDDDTAAGRLHLDGALGSIGPRSREDDRDQLLAVGARRGRQEEVHGGSGTVPVLPVQPHLPVMDDHGGSTARRRRTPARAPCPRSPGPREAWSDVPGYPRASSTRGIEMLGEHDRGGKPSGIPDTRMPSASMPPAEEPTTTRWPGWPGSSARFAHRDSPWGAVGPVPVARPSRRTPGGFSGTGAFTAWIARPRSASGTHRSTSTSRSALGHAGMGGGRRVLDERDSAPPLDPGEARRSIVQRPREHDAHDPGTIEPGGGHEERITAGRCRAVMRPARQLHAAVAVQQQVVIGRSDDAGASDFLHGRMSRRKGTGPREDLGEDAGPRGKMTTTKTAASRSPAGATRPPAAPRFRRPKRR